MQRLWKNIVRRTNESSVRMLCHDTVDDGLNSSGYVLTTLSTGTYDEVQYVDYTYTRKKSSLRCCSLFIHD